LKRQYLLFIQDILEAIQKAEEFVGTMSYEEFLADEKTKSAVVRKLEIIGEATKHVPPHIRRRYPDIPWSSMAKMRDRLAHGYWTVDYEIVWKVLKEEFVELKPKIREVYEHEQKRS
jgi:uncharacterized protein with HEPN domain